jgi:hypothetical protein
MQRRALLKLLGLSTLIAGFPASTDRQTATNRGGSTTAPPEHRDSFASACPGGLVIAPHSIRTRQAVGGPTARPLRRHVGGAASDG